MASRATNDVVAEYRKLARQRAQNGLDFRLLDSKVSELNSEDFRDYVRLTSEIDEALSSSEALADDMGWSYTTRRQALARAANGSGLDREGVKHEDQAQAGSRVPGDRSGFSSGRRW